MSEAPSFTDRQRQIANGIDRGLKYADIAKELGITERTVRAHVEAMSNKIPEFRELPPRWQILSWIRSKGWEAMVARLARKGAA